MPKIFRQDVDGADIYINHREHLPPHVHVEIDGRQAIVKIDPVALLKPTNIPSRKLKVAFNLIAENKDYLLSEWDRLTGLTTR